MQHARGWQKRYIFTFAVKPQNDQGVRKEGGKENRGGWGNRGGGRKKGAHIGEKYYYWAHAGNIIICWTTDMFEASKLCQLIIAHCVCTATLQPKCMNSACTHRVVYRG